MDLKLFISTFILIFLAELGDKTQLTAMARSAEGGKWTVFIAASSALVFSTLIAVLFGSLLTSIIPEVYIKRTAGIMFIFFGIFILYRSFLPAPEDEKKVPPLQSNLLTRILLESAAKFEESAVKDYAALAEKCDSPELKELFLTLSQEEEVHLSRVLQTASTPVADALIACTAEELPPLTHLLHDISADDQPFLEHAIDHELATAEFYNALAKKTLFPALKNTFKRLAQEEMTHAKRLQQFQKTHS